MTDAQKIRAARVAALVVTVGPFLGIGGCCTSMVVADFSYPLEWWLRLASVMGFLGAPALGSLLFAAIGPSRLLRFCACVPAAMNACALFFTLYGDSLVQLRAGGFIESQREARGLYAIVVHFLAWFVAMGVVWNASSQPAEPPKGICSKCGYDLTGNTSGVCPECGQKVVSNGAQATTR